MGNVKVEPLPILGSTGGAKGQHLDELSQALLRHGFLYVDPLLDPKVADQMVQNLREANLPKPRSVIGRDAP